MCVCLCNHPPVHEKFPNYDVVVVQPCKVNPPHLGSVAIITNLYLALPPHRILPFFWIILLLPPPYLPPTSIRSLSYPSLCLYLLPTTIPDQIAAHLDTDGTRDPPASAARLCAPRCITAPAAVSRDCEPPPFPPLPCSQVTVIPWGVCPSWGPPSSLCPHLALPEFSFEYFHLLVLGFLSGGFSREGKSPGWYYKLMLYFWFRHQI